MTYKKPQSPIMNGTDGIYPLTTADQIIKADGSRLEQGGKIMADDSAKLGGKPAAAYALKTDVEKMYSTEVLWENAAPNSAFDEQTVSFDWKGYNYCMIYFLAYVDTGLCSFSAITKKGDRLRFYFLTDTTDGTAGQYRDFYSGESRFGKAIRLKNSSSDNQNACVPIGIYGVKGV